MGKRLESAASLVRRGAVLADIGTDHGYLPIALLQKGVIERAVLSDVNEGPLSKAKDNVKLHNLLERVEFRLCDGASDLSGLGITDYSICGMGGELIARIIENAPGMREQGVRLILQPMSRVEELRKYLWRAGFSILKEIYSAEDGRFYLCILAEFSGEGRDFTEAEAYFGEKRFFDISSEITKGYFETKLSALTRARDGRMSGGIDTAVEDSVIAYAKELLNL